MHIGFISFRLAGTDGVSLETAKIAQIFQRQGHQIYYFAGELNPAYGDRDPLYVQLSGQECVESAHFTHPDILWITEHAFGSDHARPSLRARMERATISLTDALQTFIHKYNLDLIVTENVFAIPLNLPLSIALQRVVAETGIPTIAHSHDFYWERERFAVSCVKDVLASTFPPNLPNVRHLVINSQAQRELTLKGIPSQVLPNILDFAVEPPGPDAYNEDLRRALGLVDGEYFFLQPTRVIRRKGIELAIELVSRLDDLPIKLVISHNIEHDSQAYLSEMLALAARLDVQLAYIPERFKPYRVPGEGVHKVYSLWDAYIQADFITYPSLYEGFGNALLETVYLHKPLLVNRYRVYQEDIEPTGIQAVTIDGQVTDEAVQQVRQLLEHPEKIEEMTTHNFMTANKYFSYAFAESILTGVLASF
ncbi:MAG: glycosyltransferase [Lysobacterales bacterium]|nr:MAG: glycosyltransferase [Xanthomonadales bacterium]